VRGSTVRASVRAIPDHLSEIAIFTIGRTIEE